MKATGDDTHNAQCTQYRLARLRAPIQQCCNAVANEANPSNFSFDFGRLEGFTLFFQLPNIGPRDLKWNNLWLCKCGYDALA